MGGAGVSRIDVKWRLLLYLTRSIDVPCLSGPSPLAPPTHFQATHTHSKPPLKHAPPPKQRIAEIGTLQQWLRAAYCAANPTAGVGGGC